MILSTSTVLSTLGISGCILGAAVAPPGSIEQTILQGGAFGLCVYMVLKNYRANEKAASLAKAVAKSVADTVIAAHDQHIRDMRTQQAKLQETLDKRNEQVMALHDETIKVMQNTVETIRKCTR